MNQPTITTGTTAAGLHSARLTRSSAGLTITSDAAAERLFWQGVVRALQMLVWAIRSNKLEQSQEKCSHCGR